VGIINGKLLVTVCLGWWRYLVAFSKMAEHI